MKDLGSIVDSVSQLAAAVEAAVQVPALPSLSAQPCDPALINICQTALTRKNQSICWVRATNQH